jgi:polar amino acid transport system permease protein
MAPRLEGEYYTFQVVHRKNWGAWFVAIVTLGLISLFVYASVESRILNVTIFLNYLFSIEVIIGAKNALLVGTLSLLMASILGLFIALARLSGNPILVSFSAAYVYFFRGTPFLIQILFWFNAVPIMFPRIYIALPFMTTPIINSQTINVITPFYAALFGIGLAETAYMGEIIRGAIQAVDKGQSEAALALGMRRYQVMCKVIIPQVIRIIIPNTGNEYLNLLKSTSLAMTIGYMELLRVVTNIYSATFEVVELLCVAGFWYIILAGIVTALQTIFEKIFPYR